MVRKIPTLSLGLTLLSTVLLSTLFFTTHAQAAKSSHEAGGPFDMAIANEERLINMLKAAGKIDQSANIREAEAALHSILRKRQLAAQEVAFGMSETPSLTPAATRARTKGSRDFYRNLKTLKNKWRPEGVVEESYTGESRTAKLLTILIEFPDYPHNSIEPEHTDMYYADYSVAHYRQMLFNDATFPGPNGESLVSMRGYYKAQSGNSYFMTGDVAGWYTASQPAAFYGGNHPEYGNDMAPQSLVAEALLAADADPAINLADYDIEDRYDLDGDGDYWEPDGLIDHVQVFHSSIGEETAGGALGENAIWSHRWNLGGILPLANSPTAVPHWGGIMAAYDYTIQPIDAAPGVVCHEYGHDLGLPDEYDTQYSGRGEPVSFWSLMASGSWTGQIPGSQPTGFSAWSKEFLQAALGGNWLTGTQLHADDLNYRGKTLLLDQAVSKGANNDAIRVNLPTKETVIVTPVSGDWAYFSGSGDNLYNFMATSVDLTSATSAQLSFNVQYAIEQHWDYAYVTANGTLLPGTITTNDDPNGQNLGNGITGYSNGWENALFDLSAFVGAEVTLEFIYVTDAYMSEPGLYIDDISVTADGETLLIDDAESDITDTTFGGFTRDNGIAYSDHYYLLEWRTHSGVDEGLQYVPAPQGQTMASNEGLLVWYVDDYFSDNWVGYHPGDGFVGVVDADQKPVYWGDELTASTRYQIRDAAFSLKPADFLYLTVDDPEYGQLALFDFFIWPITTFGDWRNYTSPDIPDAGRNVPNYGLRFKVVANSRDGSVGKIKISRQLHRMD